MIFLDSSPGLVTRNNGNNNNNNDNEDDSSVTLDRFPLYNGGAGPGDVSSPCQLWLPGILDTKGLEEAGER